MGLGDFSNYNEVIMSRKDNPENPIRYLCVKCAIHLLEPTRAWSGHFSECGLRDDKPAPPFHLGTWVMKVGEEPTCCRCVTDRASRLYLARLVKRDREFREVKEFVS